MPGPHSFIWGWGGGGGGERGGVNNQDTEKDFRPFKPCSLKDNRERGHRGP